jgi:hypothetical protein
MPSWQCVGKLSLGTFRRVVWWRLTKVSITANRGYRIYFMGVNRPGRAVNHPPPSTPSDPFMGGSREHFTFYLLYKQYNHTLQRDVAGHSGMSVNLYQKIRRRVPEDSKLQDQLPRPW